MATRYSPYDTIQVPIVQKDYSKPLHVDCSVEYELPNTAKPPQGGRNEPLLMIHPCYFRKIESQRRSPFVNNLPVRSVQKRGPRTTTIQPPQQPSSSNATTTTSTTTRGQHLPQQIPHQGAQYPVNYPCWEMPQSCYNPPKRETVTNYGDAIWTGPERSPDRPEDNNNKTILTGKYRQYLRAHRLHPYVTSAIPLASTFPHQMQQVCYNV